jgi:hypothetical protein
MRGGKASSGHGAPRDNTLSAGSRRDKLVGVAGEHKLNRKFYTVQPC